MDLRNYAGKKISVHSLLNDCSDTLPAKLQQQQQLHQLPPPLSRHSSCASSPSTTPPTPQLTRSNSHFSQTPSPLTPSSHGTFDSIARAHLQKAQSQQQQHCYIVGGAHDRMDNQNASMYPPVPDATGAMPSVYPMPQPMTQPMPPVPMQSTHRSSNSPSSEPSRVSTISATSTAKAQPKKNQYPCPMAKQVGCSDFFTTSGHAARHAKKHTGKKDAFCPECNKAFTRKDNMEQHRRTHQNGRGGAASRPTTEDSKVRKTVKHVKKNSGKSEAQLEAAVEQQIDEQQQQQAQAQAQQAQIQAQVHAQVQAQAQAAQMQQMVTSQQMLPPNMAIDQSVMLPPAGLPYFLPSADTGPVPSLPMAMPDMSVRPPLHRSNVTNSLDYVPPAAPMVFEDPMHYSYPSPGLSNGLNSLALAASEHRRLSEEKSQSGSPTQETPSQETP